MALKRTFLVLILLSIVFALKAQRGLMAKTKDGFEYLICDTSEACNKSRVLTRVEQGPTYIDGFRTLELELNETLEVNKDIKGNLRVWLVINCEGKAYGVQFLNDLNTPLQDELKTFLEAHQNWTPGNQHGDPVDCEFILNLKVKKGKIKVLNKR